MTTVILKAAVLVSDGYSDLEFWYPVLRLREAGAQVSILGPSADVTFYSSLGYPVVPDKSISDAGDEFNLLVIPGGRAADRLVVDAAALKFTAALASEQATVVTIGTGAKVASAAGVTAHAGCNDANGLPELFRQLLAAK